MMNSPMHGTPTSGVEITNVSSHGVWLLTDDKEYFLPYEDFPWFKDAPVADVLNVKEPSPGHFYWPDLDVDISANAIENPDKYPLKSK
jgi:hypothetical protein